MAGAAELTVRYRDSQERAVRRRAVRPVLLPGTGGPKGGPNDYEPPAM